MEQLTRLRWDINGMVADASGPWCHARVAARIIDQLTAALEAAERRAKGLEVARQPGKSALPEMLALRERAEGAEKRERQSIDEARAAVSHANTQRRKAERLRARAVALQAEVTRLTAALGAAEQEKEELDDMVQVGATDILRERTRAEALQARVAELESEVEHWRFEVPQTEAEQRAKLAENRANAAESELADLRGRVKRAEALLTAEVGRQSVPVSRLARHVLEALRGR